MGIEALWSVHFNSNVNLDNPEASQGNGIVIFKDGYVYGGDTAYIYTGKYKLDNDNIETIIHVENYANFPASIFGELREFDLDIQGRYKENQFTVVGRMIGHEDYEIIISFLRRKELTL